MLSTSNYIVNLIATINIESSDFVLEGDNIAAIQRHGTSSSSHISILNTVLPILIALQRIGNLF